MYTINNFVKVKTLAEAYELNQKKMNMLLGGTLWLRMGSRTIQTAIDLSGLGLDNIEETAAEFKIGCMVSLRSLELHEGLKEYSNGAVSEAVKHIVGVQFRNSATVGGSVFGRFGFSDVLTMLLAMDTEVVLYQKGQLSLAEFIDLPLDNDILTHIIIKKTPAKFAYTSLRNTATDFPVLACAVGSYAAEVRTVIGARPGKAQLVKTALLPDEAIAEQVAGQVVCGSNLRAGKEYREALVPVLVKRCLAAIGGGAV